MNEELTYNNEKLYIADFVPDHSIRFYNKKGNEVGVLDFNGDKMIFDGEVCECADIFMTQCSAWWKRWKKGETE